MAGSRRAGRPTPTPASGGHRSARPARPARRPDPPPMEVDESKVIAVGAAAWILALVVMLIFYGKLEDHDREWWIWTAVAGLGLGCWGWVLVRKRVEERRGRK